MATFTNTSENGLEALIKKRLVDESGYERGTNADYNKEYAIDEMRLFRFPRGTKPNTVSKLGVFASDQKRLQFLNRLVGEIAKRDIIDVLRTGIKVYPTNVVISYLTPTEGNVKTVECFDKNIFSVTWQPRYSLDDGWLALYMCIFINRLPVITFELKNQLIKPNVGDAVQQYKGNRNPREVIFSFKRCMVHFAVDDARIMFCTKFVKRTAGSSRLIKGYNDGVGNPPNPNGPMPDYLWKDILTKRMLARIIENCAQVVVEEDSDTKKKIIKQIFPRYHQLDYVEALLVDMRTNDVDKRYLMQHSVGSGKSNAIAWLVRQLTMIERSGHPLFDTVIAVTDSRILDKQIRDTIKQFIQVCNTVAWAENATQLSRHITDGKRIITTAERFPFALPKLDEEHKDRRFGIIIDEAHQSQSGRNNANMNLALSAQMSDNDIDNEDKINAMMEGRKPLRSASYFAFTATPKNKTLETFGIAYQDGDDIKHRPFHVYTMKQAIQESFTLDVLAYYTPIDSYYKLMKTVEKNPMFNKRRAQKLRNFVEGNSCTIGRKEAIIVEHFHVQIIAKAKISGQACAMVVNASIPRCVEYYFAICKELADRHSLYQAFIAFSGDHKYKGQESPLTPAGLNGFSNAKISKGFKKDPYRILVIADMYQSSFDEPLLHTMYVDKVLVDIRAVQTLSRLNRAYPKKLDIFVLDFANKPEGIQKAFERYYRTTILSAGIGPNKLYNLVSFMDGYEVFGANDVEALVNLFLSGAERDKLDPVLDTCAVTYKQLETDVQTKFKSAAKFFVRPYGFLWKILPYGNADWEELSIFLNLLIPKLPTPRDDDLSEEVFEAIALESYRNETRESMAIELADEDVEIDPVPTGNTGIIVPPELDWPSVILNDFNSMFSNIKWNDADNVRRQILEIPAIVSRNERYQNAMRYSDEQSARMESDSVLLQVFSASWATIPSCSNSSRTTLCSRNGCLTSFLI